jgi:hypothetical protein
MVTGCRRAECTAKIYICVCVCGGGEVEQNNNKLTEMAEETKLQILRKGTYAWKCLSSKHLSIRVVPDTKPPDL